MSYKRRRTSGGWCQIYKRRTDNFEQCLVIQGQIFGAGGAIIQKKNKEKEKGKGKEERKEKEKEKRKGRIQFFISYYESSAPPPILLGKFY